MLLFFFFFLLFYAKSRLGVRERGARNLTLKFPGGGHPSGNERRRASYNVIIIHTKTVYNNIGDTPIGDYMRSYPSHLVLPTEQKITMCVIESCYL